MRNTILLSLFFFTSCLVSCQRDGLVIELSQPTSISFWIRWTEDKTYWEPFYLGHKRQDSETIVFGVNEEKARGKLSIKYNEKGKCKAIKSKKINDGNWHHIVWKQDGGYKGLYYGLYVDGIPMDDCLVPKNKRRAVAFEVTDKLQDKVKGIRVFDYVLSKEEIKSIYDEELRKLKMLRPITDDIFIETEAKKSEFAN